MDNERKILYLCDMSIIRELTSLEISHRDMYDGRIVDGDEMTIHSSLATLVPHEELPHLYISV